MIDNSEYDARRFESSRVLGKLIDSDFLNALNDKYVLRREHERTNTGCPRCP